MVSTAHKPYVDVDYATTGDFASPTALEANVLEFRVELTDLILGSSIFELILNNKEGQYESTFPAIPNEAGLYDFIKFTINGKEIGRFRISEIEPFADLNGDKLRISGYGLDDESDRRKAVAGSWRGATPETIMEGALTAANNALALTDLSTSMTIKDASPPLTYFEVPSSSNVYLRDVLRDVAEENGYSLFVNCTSYPAVIWGVKKGHADVQLNTHLYFDKVNNSNNVLSASVPRTVREIKNYITLDQSGYFCSWIPNDGNAWTDVLDGWGVTTGTLTLDPDTYYATGYGCILAQWTGPPPPSPVDFHLIFSNTGFADDVNIDSTTGLDLDYLSIAYRVNGASQTIRVTLWDDASPAHKLYRDISPTTTNWESADMAIGGDWALWTEVSSGDKAAFTDIISRIQFVDQASTYYTWKIQGIKFYRSGTYATQYLYMQDSTSVSDYGRREQEVKRPYDYLWRRMDLWGAARLNGLKNPLRIITLRCHGGTAGIDPATVVEDDGSTPAPLFPSWSLQFEADRWAIPAAGETNGTWWRILRVMHEWGSDGYFVELDITPVGSEGASSEDYSYVISSRYGIKRDPVSGFLSNIMERLNQLDRTAQTIAVSETLVSLVPHHHTIADGSGQVDTDQPLDVNDQPIRFGSDEDSYFRELTDDVISLYINGAEDFQFTANDFIALAGSTFTSPSLHLIDSGTSYDLILASDSTTPFNADRILTLDLDNGARTLILQANLTVEAASLLNQDLTSDASPTFAGLTIGTLAGLLKAAAGVVSAITASADLASIISDETGSGALVFATSPVLVTPTLGVASATSLTAGNLTMNVDAGDFRTTSAGKGLIVKTPNNTASYRIRVDDSGNLVTEVV